MDYCETWMWWATPCVKPRPSGSSDFEKRVTWITRKSRYDWRRNCAYFTANSCGFAVLLWTANSLRLNQQRLCWLRPNSALCFASSARQNCFAMMVTLHKATDKSNLSRRDLFFWEGGGTWLLPLSHKCKCPYTRVIFRQSAFIVSWCCSLLVRPAAIICLAMCVSMRVTLVWKRAQGAQMRGVRPRILMRAHRCGESR